jgi:glycosyltransferase involved in cell wall biosynthesis
MPTASPLAASSTSLSVDARKPPSVPVQPTYVLISPVYNEEKFIGRMIESIAAQTVLPSRWLIVDDGSTDGTPEIIRTYLQRYSFIELICFPKSKACKPGGEGVIQRALGVVQFYPYDFLGRFDTDLEFRPDYIAKMLGEFARDEKLGIAGGGLYVEKSGRLVLEKVPKCHVRGGLKMYRRKCLEEIGSLCPHIGWDTIDEVYAWRNGWKTRSFFENRVIHQRPTGGRLTARELPRQHAQAEYQSWSHPLFVFLKAVKIGSASPTRGIRFLGAFVECYRKQEARLQDADFKRIRRKQQLRRLVSAGILT